jgi:hypothetical protein
MLKHLLTATAALALMAGAAHAQTAPASPPAATPDASPKPMDSATTTSAAPAPMTEPAAAPAATTPAASSNASAVVSVATVTNGPVADTPENRAKYGQPMSRAGKRTTPKGN